MARRADRANHRNDAGRTTSGSPLPVATGGIASDLLYPELAEFLRKSALGLLALLIVARAFYPSEDADAGTGLAWVLLMLGAAGLGVAANLLGGITWARRSWVDVAVLVLVLLVAASAGHAADRRPAITMAWEWGGMGLLFFLVRNLPRSRGESAALALIVVATGAAVATYGLYQVGFEFAGMRQAYQSNPARMLALLNIPPGSPSAVAFEQRLLHSNEPFSTFALANSLAGLLVAAMTLVIGVVLENLRGDIRNPGRSRLWLAALPGLALMVCLVLTKSRSAYVGFAVGLVALARRYRSAVPRRWLLGSGIALVAILGGLIVAGVASRQLDIQILTEARKSLGYRWEYWVGSWGIITDAPPPIPANPGGGVLGVGSEVIAEPSSRVFWWGVGPANFAGPYRRHKLPEASEEIRDPHNLIFEVWSESGLFAAVALVASLLLGVRESFGRARPGATGEMDSKVAAISRPSRPNSDAIPTWVVVAGGLGWFGVWVLGRLDPLARDESFWRWLVLGTAWATAALLLMPAWNRRPIPAAAAGAAVLAMGVSLLAVGGIGYPSVAMVLWSSLALGLNLREDRPCGRLRAVGGLGTGVAVACLWAVLVGTYYGAVAPGWRAEAEVALGQELMAGKEPAFEAARNAYLRAIETDRYAIAPWLSLAELEYRFWRSPEAGERHKRSWMNVMLAFDKALEGNYRNPDDLFLRRQQAAYARKILDELPVDAKPFEVLGLRTAIARATRHAVRLYPTSAALRAELAQASADLGMYADAAAEARVALRLDEGTPHADKKLPDLVRAGLRRQLESWTEQAKLPPPTAPR